MSLENVKTYFAEYGMENRILEFSVSSATVDLAAQAVGCEPGRIAKTLSFCGEKGCGSFSGCVPEAVPDSVSCLRQQQQCN